MKLVLRLVETGIDGSSRSVDVLEIVSRSDPGDIAALGHNPVARQAASGSHPAGSRRGPVPGPCHPVTLPHQAGPGGKFSGERGVAALHELQAN